MSKLTGAVLLIFALLIPTALVVAWFYSQRVLPETDGLVTVPSLSHPAEVRFDERGVPYIQAKTEPDVYLTQGFVTASERMFQMDISRRTANGELADIFGSGSVDHDKLMRNIGFNRLAKDEYKQLPPDTKALLDAYCQGVNNYIDWANGRMPIEFLLLGAPPRQWQPVDTLAILKYSQYEEEESWQLDDLRQRILDKGGDKFAAFLFEQNLKPGGETTAPIPDAVQGAPKPHNVSCMPACRGHFDQLPDLPQLIAAYEKLMGSGSAPMSLRANGVLPSSQPIWGSNAWVVGGAMTDSKGCLLAFDHHSAFTAPDKYYICSLSTPELHVAGGSLPGVPGVFAGRNENISWGATLLHADSQDLVLEQLSPQFPGKYRTVSGWENVQEHGEDISVRFARAVSFRASRTKHGPVLLQNETSAVSLAWSGFDSKESTLKSIFQLSKAKNWHDFCASISAYPGSARTFVYADKLGNIGYHVAGSIPVRTNDGATVTPGWTGAAEWHGCQKFDELAHGYNPSQTYMVADNPKFVSTTYINNPLRALRIGTVLGAYKQSSQKVGLPEMALLQGDLAASFAPMVKTELEQTVARSQVIDEFQLQALEIMRKWDGNLSGDSAAATIYESFVRTLTRRMLEPKLGAKLTQEYLERWPRWTLLTQKILGTKPKEWLPPEERTYDTFIITTFAQSLKNVRLSGKSEDLSKCTWQSLHQIKFQPILTMDGDASKLTNAVFGVNPTGVGGDQDTVNACNVAATVDPWNFSSDSGPTFRMLADMSDPDKFYVSLPLGQSEHLFSPYKTDQLHNWLRLEPHSIAFSPAQLEKQQQHKVIFTNQ